MLKVNTWMIHPWVITVVLNVDLSPAWRALILVFSSPFLYGILLQWDFCPKYARHLPRFQTTWHVEWANHSSFSAEIRFQTQFWPQTTFTAHSLGMVRWSSWKCSLSGCGSVVTIQTKGTVFLLLHLIKWSSRSRKQVCICFMFVKHSAQCVNKSILNHYI